MKLNCVEQDKYYTRTLMIQDPSGGSRGGSLGSKEPPSCSLDNRINGCGFVKSGRVPEKNDEKNPPCESSGSASGIHPGTYGM